MYNSNQIGREIGEEIFKCKKNVKPEFFEPELGRKKYVELRE